MIFQARGWASGYRIVKVTSKVISSVKDAGKELVVMLSRIIFEDIGGGNYQFKYIGIKIVVSN